MCCQLSLTAGHRYKKKNGNQPRNCKCITFARANTWFYLVHFLNWKGTKQSWWYNQAIKHMVSLLASKNKRRIETSDRERKQKSQNERTPPQAPKPSEIKSKLDCPGVDMQGQ